MFSMLDEIKEINEENSKKLKIMLSIMDITLSREQKIINEFYNQQIGVKLVSFLPRLGQE